MEGLDFASMYTNFAPSPQGFLQYVDPAGKPNIGPSSKIYSDKLRDKVKEALIKRFQEAHEDAR